MDFFEGVVLVIVIFRNLVVFVQLIFVIIYCVELCILKDYDFEFENVLVEFDVKIF